MGQKRRASRFILFIFLLIKSNSPHDARAAGRLEMAEDASSVIKNQKVGIAISRNGLYKETDETVVKLLRENGREQYRALRFTYFPDEEKLATPQVWVQNGNTVKSIKADSMVNEPLESDEDGFEHKRQFTVALSNLEAGTEIHWRTERVTREDPNHSFFSAVYKFGARSAARKKTVELNSDKEIFMTINDPARSLKITKDVVKGRFHLLIEFDGGFSYDIDQENLSVIGKNAIPWVAVSTETSWSNAFELTAQAYEKAINQNLPLAYQKIADQSQRFTTAEEKIAFVLGQVQKAAFYFGDWRKPAQGQLPQSLKFIAEKGRGDCKDLVTSVVSILRKLGFEAHVAFVKRGEDLTEFYDDTIVVDGFDHLIVWVKSGDKEYWLDPTNSQVYLGLRPDIMNRSSIVLWSGGQSRLKKIGLPSPGENMLMVKKEVQTDETLHTSQVRGKLFFKGVYATRLPTGDNNKVVTRELLEYTSASRRASDYKLSKFDEQAPVMTPTKIDFYYKDNAIYTRTFGGKSFKTDAFWGYEEIVAADPDRVSDLSLGFPRVRIEQTILVGQRVAERLRPDCWIDSPWLSITRTEKQTQKGFEIDQVLTYKSDRIPAQSFSTPEFKKFQQTVEVCFDEFAFNVEPVEGPN